MNSQITPTCYVYNNRTFTSEIRFTGATVVSETKTTITVKTVGSGTAFTFQKRKDHLSGQYEDPRVGTLRKCGYGLGSIEERGGDRFFSNQLTFDLDGVAAAIRRYKDVRRQAQLTKAKAQLVEQRAALVHVGYMKGDEVLDCIDKTLAAYDNDLAYLDAALKL